MKLCFCLTTCEPKTIRKLLLPSLIYLNELKDICKLLICFQPPYTEKEIEDVCKFLDALNIKYDYFYKDYEINDNKIPILKMRQDCSLLQPNSEYYALLDDDMEFGKDTYKYYLKALEDLDNNSNIGVVSLNRAIKENIESEFTDYNQNCYATDNGLIFRSGKYYGFKGLFPEKLSEIKNIKTLIKYENENILDLFGGHEDKFGAIIRLATGQRGKIYYNVPGKHESNRPKVGLHHDKFFWQDHEDISVCGFIRKYFSKEYHFQNCTHCFDENLLKEIYNLE